MLSAALIAAFPQQTSDQPNLRPLLNANPNGGKPELKGQNADATSSQFSLSAQSSHSSEIVLINGALYTVMNGQPIPVPGGGASGCLDVTGNVTAQKIAAAKAALSAQPKDVKQDE